MANVKVEANMNLVEAKKLDKGGDMLVFVLGKRGEKPVWTTWTDEQVKGLSAQNRTRWQISKEVFDTQPEDDPMNVVAETVEPAEDIQLDMRAGTGTKRLEVRNKRKGTHYVWKRPENVDAYIERGYRVVNDPNVKTLRNRKGGIHKINRTDRDGDELVLMEVAESVSKARRAEKVREYNEEGERAKMAALRRMNSPTTPAIDFNP